MNKLRFKFNKERDALNFWELCNSECFWKNEKADLDTSYINLFKEKSFEESKDHILSYLKSVHESHYIGIFKESLTRSWELINDEYFNRLEKITNSFISSEDFTAYITTVGRCTYRRDNTFTVSLKRPLLQAMRICGHELLHLCIDNLYGDWIRRRIGEDKFDFLNESLTVLLNLEFRDLWYVKDIGYAKNKNLRNLIATEWTNEKDFEKLLEGCINYLKN